MKTNNNKGFTLIELIMVIVILGILAAVVVPKFFSLTDEAHAKNKKSVIGTIKSGLNLYAANQLVANGSRDFPTSGTTDGALVLTSILDEVPADWSVVGSSLIADTIGYQYGANATATSCYVYTYTAATVGPPATSASYGIGAEIDPRP